MAGHESEPVGRDNRFETILYSSLPEEVIARVAGNAPRKVKEVPIKWLALFRPRKHGGFAWDIAESIAVTDVSIVPSLEDRVTMECRVTYEVKVEKDMLGLNGALHNGFMALLIDETSSASTGAYFLSKGENSTPFVTQTMNMYFHSTAAAGTKLRIIGRTLTGELSAVTCRSEIWDAENHRLIAHGEQRMMPPSH
ncbi:hypothetical protein AX17_006489 [Amanita inopinata Kibby_2008]|nr:hypothetical protein AX17_006489 [Amanita inopinata Kibby_2008]